MKKIFAALFVLLIFGLALLSIVFYNKQSSSNTTREIAKTIVPITEKESTSIQEKEYLYTSIDETKEQPLFNLENDETFLQVISFDINKDGRADQICAIKKATEVDLLIIPAIQNPLTGEYTRLSAIQTGITQSRTLVLYTVDLIGDRNNAIIVSGMNSENQQILAAYIPYIDENNKINLSQIINILADGSISIQDFPRSDAYNLGITQGKSFPIFSYNSDPTSPGTLDQIEREYNWDSRLRRYTKSSESKIPGKKIESKFLSQLQQGNLSSFEQFLDGLWYFHSQQNVKPKNIFFDSIKNEIIFYDNNIQEIFSKETSAPRRYGVYFTTRNTLISNIRRILDIELVGIDEIRIRVIDDVNLKIAEASEWNGLYKKRAEPRSLSKENSNLNLEKVNDVLTNKETTWVADSGQTLTLSPSGYKLVVNATEELGLHTFFSIEDNVIMQLKSKNTTNNNSFYLVEVNTKDKAELMLTEVKINAPNVYKAGSPTIVFVEAKNKE